MKKEVEPLIQQSELKVNNASRSKSDLLTENELADYLSISVAALRKWRLQGRGPTFLKLSTLVRYRIEDVHGWLSKRPQGGERLHTESEIGEAN